MTRWFKMLAGVSENQTLAFIAKKSGHEKSSVIGIFTAASDLFQAGKSRDQVIELLDFIFSDNEKIFPTAIIALLHTFQEHGLMDADGSLSGIEKTTPDAERKRKWREKQKMGQSQDSPETVTGQVTRRERDQTRETREKDPLIPQPVINGQGMGSFKKLVGVGSGGSSGFDIREHLKDDDFTAIYRHFGALGWENKFLFEKYNAYVANDPPRSPGVNSFIAWAKSFTKGKRA